MKTNENQIADLLRRAGPRPAPPADVAQRVRDAVHSEWQDRVQRRRRTRRTWLGAMAAGLVGLIGVTVWLSSQPGPGVAATVLRVAGTGIEFADRQGRAVAPTAGVLPSFTRVQTGPGARLALGLGSGAELRIDEHSQVILTSATEAQLMAGRVYFDSGSQGVAVDYTVTTPVGGIEHVGTQFFAAYSAGELRVGVREGSVRVSHGASGATQVATGSAITVATDATVQTKPLHPIGPAWSWAEAVSPASEAEGRTIDAFVHWVARETGRTIRYQSREVETAARRNRLRGRVEAPPLQALETLLQTTDLKHELRDEVILILPRRASL